MFNQVKIVVFVPSTHADLVRQVMGDAGAGRIGLYSHCSYSLNGTGRYMPLAGSRPAIGDVGKFEEFAEERVECVCDKEYAKAVIAAIRDVHPYEEAAIDIYPLLTEAEL